MTIAQKPNAPIIVALGGWLLAYLVADQPIHLIGQLIYIVGLFIWSILEIFDGVNWLRRIFGVIGLYFVVQATISLLR